MRAVCRPGGWTERQILEDFSLRGLLLCADGWFERTD